MSRRTTDCEALRLRWARSDYLVRTVLLREQMITLKRAYDSVSRADGSRFLVERLWPRGVGKAALRLDAWLKDAGPSTELRKWFSHDPAKWVEFRRRYFRELDARPEAWQPIASAARRGTVHADLQLTRHAAQQCGRIAGVSASTSVRGAEGAGTVTRGHSAR